MAKQVVITRPLAQSTLLANRVHALGHPVVVLPLLEITPLLDSSALNLALNDLSSYVMVAFVSPNAVDAVFSRLAKWPDGLAIAVMGEGSRQALAAYGITDTCATILSPSDPERTDSETLLQVLDLAYLREKKVLIVRGESGRELLADALRSHRVEVTQLAAYRRSAPKLDDALRAQLSSLLETQSDWIVTSSEALRILISVVTELGLEQGVEKIQRQRMIVPHIRIAETARAMGFCHVCLTGSGDERLLAALQS
ncbi:MAG: uroporphyrinogen-III synthase [Pseudomonadota bacterium]